jgi:hypothetical protein
VKAKIVLVKVNVPEDADQIVNHPCRPFIDFIDNQDQRLFKKPGVLGKQRAQCFPVSRRFDGLVEKALEQQRYAGEKRFRGVVLFYITPLHGHHLDGELIVMLLFNLFFHLLNEPCFTGLLRRPQREIVTAFLGVAKQLLHASADQIRSGDAEMGFGIDRAV